ncbi:MAG: hypothetical protein H7Y86_22055 [Rhizobacter sp.]|nr:hypothetical protein [Ferruginibacter sp.]
MITPKMKIGAGVICILYILVQTFQWWVFTKAPSANPTLLEDFLFGAKCISILRSSLMLASMFGLFYLFFVICFFAGGKYKASAILAFISFSIFCLLEIMLRSVELFYTQVQLPAVYANTTSSASRELILYHVTQFQNIQFALYFPLGLSQTIGSFIIAFIYPATPRFNYLLKAIMLLNGLRLLLRQLTVYAGINLFPDNLYDTLYLPLVYLTFGVTALWLFKSAYHDKRLLNMS